MAKVKKQLTSQHPPASLNKPLKAKMETSSQKIKAANGQPILLTKGAISAKEKLFANTSKKRKIAGNPKPEPAIKIVDIAEKAKPQTSVKSNSTEAAGNFKENSTAVKKPDINVASSEKTKPSNNWLLFKSQIPATNPQKQYWRKNVEKPTVNKSAKSQFSTNITDVVAIDCEMVGGGENGKDNLLARVSVVNKFNEVLYDTFVKPREPVTDYRTQFSGVRESDLETAVEFKDAQAKVAELINKRILVGHDIRNDLKVLFLGHPFTKIRDTAKYHPFKQLKSGRPSLKFLSEEILGIKIQHGEHNSIEDAKATMSLYMMHQNEWERLRKEKKVPKDKVADKSRMRKNWDRTNNANKWHSQTVK